MLGTVDKVASAWQHQSGGGPSNYTYAQTLVFCSRVGSERHHSSQQCSCPLMQDKESTQECLCLGKTKVVVATVAMRIIILQSSVHMC